MGTKELLLETAFACMACDGEIAIEEVQLIKNMAKKDNLFGSIDINKELDRLVSEINQKGKAFLKEYFKMLENASLTTEEELEVLRIAAKTIQADNKVEYSEIKFFKIIRSYLKVSDETILENVKEIDEYYLEQDIKSDDNNLFDSYFNEMQFSDLKIIE